MAFQKKELKNDLKQHIKSMKTRTLIGITTKVEGFHYFAGAVENFGKEVTFLEFPHRHLFGIECKALVNHNDRDKEFILLKREVIDYLYKKYAHEEALTPVCDFGGMSCEMIAEDLLKRFDFEYVKVDEDGENYAEVSKVEECEESAGPKVEFIKHLSHIDFIIGKSLTGKSYLADQLFEQDAKAGRSVLRIEVGELVREITKTKERVFDDSDEMQGYLIEKLSRLLFENMGKYDVIRIVGIRQEDVFKHVYSGLSVGCSIHIYLTIASIKERKRRFKKSQTTEKNKGLTFEELIKGEEKLGIDQLINGVLNQNLNSENFTVVTPDFKF